MSSFFRNLASICLTVGCTIASSCGHAPAEPPSAPPHTTQLAVRPPALRAESLYFSGKLKVEALVSRGRPGSGPEGGERAARGGRPGGRRHGGAASMGGPGGEARDDSDDGTPRLNLHASSLPPVTLRVKLTNLSPAPLDVQVREVKSELGDFAVRPEHLLLAPDQSGEVDPMISQLGAPGEGFPITISVRVAGQIETHELILDVVKRPLGAP